MSLHARWCQYFNCCHQEVANKMSAVKFYRPVKCNLIKAVKCLLYWLLVQQHSDSRMMEDAINGIINEPTRCLRDQMVPFSGLTYSNKQWEVKTVVIAPPAARSSSPSLLWLITLQFLCARSFTSAALATARSVMVLGKCRFIIAPSTGILNVGQFNSFNLKLFELACRIGF